MTGVRERQTEQDRGIGGGCLVWHIIHLIAIRKNLPAPEFWTEAGWWHFGSASVRQSE